MSHLPHVVDFRAKLLEKGITCASAQEMLVQEPFIHAITRWHFKRSDCLSMNQDEQDRVWEQLDCWNKVSPIKAQYIMESVKYRLNTVRQQLIRRGEPPVLVDWSSVQSRDLMLTDTAVILVDYLLNELVNRHE